MRIKNYKEFYEFIKPDSLPIKTQLLNCISSIINTCACNQSLKNKKSLKCNEIYVDWIKNNASNLTDYWKQKTNDKTITFCQNDTFEIKTINLS